MRPQPKPSIFKKAQLYITKNTGKFILWLIGSGGVLTLVGIWKLFISGPHVEFLAQHSDAGSMGDSNKAYYYYLVDAAIVNNGDKAYFPSTYKMEVEYADKTVIFQTFPIRDSFFYENKGPLKLYITPAKDLTRVTKIAPDDNASGFILFRTEINANEGNIDVYHYKSMQFEMIDVRGKKIESEKYGYSPYRIERRYLPQYGVETK